MHYASYCMTYNVCRALKKQKKVITKKNLTLRLYPLCSEICRFI